MTLKEKIDIIRTNSTDDLIHKFNLGNNKPTEIEKLAQTLGVYLIPYNFKTMNQ